jgi:hypothetical protein
LPVPDLWKKYVCTWTQKSLHKSGLYSFWGTSSQLHLTRYLNLRSQFHCKNRHIRMADGRAYMSHHYHNYYNLKFWSSYSQSNLVLTYSVLCVLCAVCETNNIRLWRSFNSASTAEYVEQNTSGTKCECKWQVHTQDEMQQTSEYNIFHFIDLIKTYIVCTVCVSLASSKHGNICIPGYHNGSISAQHPLTWGKLRLHFICSRIPLT